MVVTEPEFGIARCQVQTPHGGPRPVGWCDDGAGVDEVIQGPALAGPVTILPADCLSQVSGGRPASKTGLRSSARIGSNSNPDD